MSGRRHRPVPAPKAPARAPRSPRARGARARELGGGRDLDLLDLAERALREGREPAQRFDLDVEHVHPNRALLRRREDVEQAAAHARTDRAPRPARRVRSPAATSSSRALVEVEQLADAQRERVRAQRRVGHLLPQGDGADDDDGRPARRSRRRRAAGLASRCHRAARRARRRAGRPGARGARDATRRRRPARGSSAPAAGQPGAQVACEVARGAVVSRRRRASAAQRACLVDVGERGDQVRAQRAERTRGRPRARRRCARRLVLGRPRQRRSASAGAASPDRRFARPPSPALGSSRRRLIAAAPRARPRGTHR